MELVINERSFHKLFRHILFYSTITFFILKYYFYQINTFLLYSITVEFSLEYKSHKIFDRRSTKSK